MRKKYQYIILEESDSLTNVWLNRPEKHNALNVEMMNELSEIFQRIDETKTRLVVIGGKGNSFCAGADLSWMKNAASITQEENIADAKQLAELLYHIYNSAVPVIASVHGAVYGGAIGILSACDFVWAEAKSTFCFSECKLGLSPSTIMPYVLKRLTKQVAKELIFTARIFNADEAQSYNLVDTIIEQKQLESVISSYLLQIKSTAPGAVKESKRLINSLDGEINNNVLEHTVESLAKRRSSEEAIKGITAFINKENISWD